MATEVVGVYEEGPPGGGLARMARFKLIIVDDDPTYALAARAWLAARGHECVVQPSPFGIAAVVRRERPDVVLLDLEMPGMDGERLIELLGRLPELGLQGVILHSSRTVDELERLAAAKRVLGAVPKGGIGAAFVDAVERLVEQRRASGGSGVSGDG